MLKQSLEIIIPAYNEEKNIEKIIDKSFKFLKKNAKNYMVLVVDDGSTDKTFEILKKLEKKYSRLKVLHHKKNLGIGMAWRTLYQNSEKDIILTCPADLQFDPDDFSIALPLIEHSDAVAIYRLKKGDYTFFRKILSKLNKKALRLFFGFNIKDINWVKIYRREALKNLDLKLKSSLVESEIMAKLKKRKKIISEIGAPHYPRIYGKPKGADLRNLFRTGKEFLRLYFVVLNFR